MLKHHLRKKTVNGTVTWELKLPSGRYILDKPKGWMPGTPLYIGEGGLSCTFKFHSAGDPSKAWVIKDMKQPKEGDLAHKKALENMRLNLTRLIQRPIAGVGDIMVPPVELIDFPETETFGYLMQFVDLSRYRSVTKIHDPDIFPDAEKLCAMGMNLSTFYHVLGQGTGLCYKDVNEGNIYLNPEDGSVRVIDNDNIGVPAVVTIEGTDQYRAPEIFTDGCLPDMYTDSYQLATYLLRLFTGAYPLDGRRVQDYCRQHGTTLYEREAQEEMLGRQALFVFHPTDRRNALPDDKTNPDYPVYAEQQKHWDRLPPELKAAFTGTFTNLTMANRALRTTAMVWKDTFTRLRGLLTTCPKCKKKTFGTSGVCYFCGTKLVPHATCLSCRKKTFRDNPRCVHCLRLWNEPVAAKVTCPSCKHENPADAKICSACKKYMFTGCSACGKPVSILKDVCACGRGPVWQRCQNPDCGKKYPIGLDACPFCHRKQAERAQCPDCKRYLFPGENRCPRCGRQVAPAEQKHKPVSPASAPAPAPGVKPPAVTALRPGISRLELVLHARINGQKKNPIKLQYKAGDSIILSAKSFDPALSDTPLFAVKTIVKKRLPALVNLTGDTPTVCRLTLSPDGTRYDKTPLPGALAPGSCERVEPVTRIDLNANLRLVIMSFRVLQL